MDAFKFRKNERSNSNQTTKSYSNGNVGIKLLLTVRIDEEIEGTALESNTFITSIISIRNTLDQIHSM